MKSNLLTALAGIVLLWSGAHWFEKLNHIYRLTPMGQLVQAAAFAAACAGALVVVWGCCRSKERVERFTGTAASRAYLQTKRPASARADFQSRRPGS